MLKDLWNEMKGGILLLGIILTLYYTIKPQGLIPIIILITIPTIIYDLIKEGWEGFKIKKILVMWLVITIIYYLNTWSALYGLWGFIGIVLLFSFYRLFKAKRLILKVMQNIETKIWGAPLDDEKYWKEKKENETISKKE